MELTPLKRYEKPYYPGKQAVIENPELLKMLPERWKKSKLASLALSSMLLLSITGCGQKNVSGSNGTDNDYTVERQLVAPVFEHGNGRGSFGCVSVAPPAFLSEEEAFQIIKEEGAKEGLNFEITGTKIEDARIPVTSTEPDLEESKEGEEEKSLKTKKAELVLDGYDKNRDIGFEFVSREDITAWSDGEVRSTVETYETLRAARTLSHENEGKIKKGVLGVFYDPVSYITSKGFTEETSKILKDEGIQWEDKEKKLKALSEQELREQVRDFLKWLKGQGIV